jgi:uncharacterized membrane protein
MNRETTAHSNETVWMDARIRPNIALSGTGAATFSTLMALPSIIVGLVLALQGAWIATLFVCVTSISLMLIMMHHAATLSAYEERVLLTDAALVVETSVKKGKPPVRRRISPHWLKLERRNEEGGGCGSLVLWSREKPYVVASVLSPLERAAFADALEAGLRLRSGRPA